MAAKKKTTVRKKKAPPQVVFDYQRMLTEFEQYDGGKSVPTEVLARWIMGVASALHGAETDIACLESHHVITDIVDRLEALEGSD